MAAEKRLICASAELANGGSGHRFSISESGRDIPAFVVRFKDRAYAYVNQCGHIPAELDWRPGELFDDSKLYLICSVHGALYAPETGQCLGGRCQGKGLVALPVVEANGQVFLKQEIANG